MTTFADGPARRAILHLQRAPIMLRVCVQFNTGAEPTYDALDQLDDVPQADEKLFCYRIVGAPGVMFIDGRDNAGRRFGRQEMTATYRFLQYQPCDDIMRDNAKWRAWCLELQKRERLPNAE